MSLPQKTPRSNTTIAEWINDASRQLKDAAIPSFRLDAEILLSHTLNMPRTHLHAHTENEISDRDREIANARLDLRLDHVPIAYIIGHKEFYGRRFNVTTATLIPRPESEVMIDLLKEVMPANTSILTETKRLVDVGTGSGILGITAKLLYPELDVTLLDVSRHALNVAEKNAKMLEADVTVLQSDLLTNYLFKADYIMANLPYVDSSWDVSPELQHEPAEALFAGNGGLALINRLLIQAPRVLAPSGFLFIEADPEQHEAIIAEAKNQRLILHTQRDYQLVFQAL